MSPAHLHSRAAQSCIEHKFLATSGVYLRPYLGSDSWESVFLCQCGVTAREKKCFY